MTRGNLSLVIPMVAILMLAIGVINEEQNAYASGQDPFIWCDIEGEWERGEGFWTEGTCEGDLIGDREGSFEVEVEVHGEFEVGDQTEGRCKEVSTELTIYSGNGEGLEGTITAEAEGEICREGRNTTTTWQDLEITGATGDFSSITGSYDGEFHSEMEREEGDFEATIHAYLIIGEQPQVVEVHCEVEYEFEMFLIFGERHGYGECVYIFSDGSEEEHEVSVGGEFVVGSLVEGFRTIEGTFHIEDYEDNALWLDEEGSVEINCDIETEEEEEFETPYCLETDVTVEEGEGIFSFLDGSGTRTAEGYFTTEFIFTEGYAYSTIWIFFDCEECEPEEEELTKKGGGGCSNCQQPSIGVTETGKRVVDGGITVNGHTIDADFYHTVYPLIQAKIGTPIDFVFKIWDDRENNIKHVQVQLGKNKVGESFNQVGSVTWDRNVMTKVATVTHDPMFRNVHMERHIDQDCKVGGTPCTVIHVRITPTVAIVGNVVFGVNIWDDGKNTVTSFFNDGIQIGTEADIIIEEPIDRTVYKNQLRTDDGLGNIDKRYSDAFQMKLDWHNANIDRLVDQLGY